MDVGSTETSSVQPLEALSDVELTKQLRDSVPDFDNQVTTAADRTFNKSPKELRLGLSGNMEKIVRNDLLRRQFEAFLHSHPDLAEQQQALLEEYNRRTGKRIDHYQMAIRNPETRMPSGINQPDPEAEIQTALTRADQIWANHLQEKAPSAQAQTTASPK